LNSKNKSTLQTILIALIFFLALFIWTIWQFHFNYMISVYDTFFHSQRIYELRLAFANRNLPSWVNFNSFFNTGQAINGMYPDFTLWPFVLLTNFLTPIHQIIAIKSLIAAATFIVSFLSLNKRFNSQNAMLAATIFTLSGSALKDLVNEMQTGTAIVMIFAFPIIFNLKDILESNQINPKLIIKTALLMTIVINSHLLSAVAITLITGLFLIIRTIIKRTYQPWINLAVAGLLTVILSSPIIYRIVTISKTGLQTPFGKGHITSDPIWTLFLNARWNSKSAISLASIILIVITLIKLNKQKLQALLPWIYVESALIIFSSNIIPWKILDSIPIINTFQVANWRFAPFLGMVPIIMILINFNQKVASRIVLTMVIVSYPFAFKTATDAQFKKTSDLPLITQNTKKRLPPNTGAKLTSTGITSDQLFRTLVPDYTPDTTPLQKNSGGYNLDQQLAYLLVNHIGTTKLRDIPLTHKSSTNGITLNGQNVPQGNIVLPVYGYKSLNYLVTINNQPANWSITKKGFITVNSSKDLADATYKITQIQPKIYPALIWMSTVLYLALIGILLTPTVKKLRR